MKEKPVSKCRKALKTLAFIHGTPDGIRTHDLQSRSFKNGVFYRFITCHKALINQDFFILTFCIVVQNNSTFCNGVEFLLNYF